MQGEFTLFLSGVEPEEHFNIVSNYTKNILLSYYYIRRRGIDEIEARLKKNRGMKILIDSGAFTFFKDPQYAKKSVEWWEKYLKNYIKFIQEHRNYIFACVELDIDSIVGSEQVEEWRKKYFYPLEESGVRVIYLYHLDKDLDYFEDMCRKHAYVGFSYVELKNSIDDNDLIQETVSNLFDIAKKYKTAIHGFAITGNKMLLNYPFLSADSTTYTMGAQYGNIVYFDGGALRHLDKDTWKSQYIPKLVALGLKEDLLRIENPYELIKANVIGYKKFEEYLRQLHVAQRYWEGRVTTKFKLPEYEWFNSSMEDWESKLLDAGIDTNIPKDVGITLLRDMYVILNNLDEIKSYSIEDLIQLCSIFGATGVAYNTKEKCLRFLKIAFREHLDGKRSELSDLQRSEEKKCLSLERDSYIDDSEEKEIELSKEDCGKILPALLTDGYDKDSVERELIASGIQPVYDKDGNILKGIKTVKKQIKLSNKALPRLSCDRCVMASNCTEYKPGYICAYDTSFRNNTTRNIDDIIGTLTAIADVQVERAKKAFMQETAMGGVPTKTTSQALKDAWDFTFKLKELYDETNIEKPVTIQHTKVSGGSIETTTVRGKNPEQGGILEKIFFKDAIDVDAQVL